MWRGGLSRCKPCEMGELLYSPSDVVHDSVYLFFKPVLLNVLSCHVSRCRSELVHPRRFISARDNAVWFCVQRTYCFVVGSLPLPLEPVNRLLQLVLGLTDCAREIQADGAYICCLWRFEGLNDQPVLFVDLKPVCPVFSHSWGSCMVSEVKIRFPSGS